MTKLILNSLVGLTIAILGGVSFLVPEVSEAKPRDSVITSGLLRGMFFQAAPITDARKLKLKHKYKCAVDLTESEFSQFAGKFLGSRSLSISFKRIENFIVVDQSLEPLENGVHRENPYAFGMLELGGVVRMAAYKLDLSGAMVTPELRETSPGALMIMSPFMKTGCTYGRYGSCWNGHLNQFMYCK